MCTRRNGWVSDRLVVGVKSSSSSSSLYLQVLWKWDQNEESGIVLAYHLKKYYIQFKWWLWKMKKQKQTFNAESQGGSVNHTLSQLSGSQWLLAGWWWCTHTHTHSLGGHPYLQLTRDGERVTTSHVIWSLGHFGWFWTSSISIEWSDKQWNGPGSFPWTLIGLNFWNDSEVADWCEGCCLH